MTQEQLDALKAYITTSIRWEIDRALGRDSFHADLDCRKAERELEELFGLREKDAWTF